MAVKPDAKAKHAGEYIAVEYVAMYGCLCEKAAAFFGIRPGEMFAMHSMEVKQQLLDHQYLWLIVDCLTAGDFSTLCCRRASVISEEALADKVEVRIDIHEASR